MFVKVTQSGFCRYAQLVESFRNEQGKPRQRTLCKVRIQLPLPKQNAGASIKPAAMAISPLAGAGAAALGARCCRSRQ